MSDILCWKSFKIPTDLSSSPTLSLETPRVERKLKILKYSTVPITLELSPVSLSPSLSWPNESPTRNWLRSLSHPPSITLPTKVGPVTFSFERYLTSSFKIISNCGTCFLLTRYPRVIPSSYTPNVPVAIPVISYVTVLFVVLIPVTLKNLYPYASEL